MTSMNDIVAHNVRRLRSERGISLDELARLSSVSKSMLAGIERGDGNPTIGTLWKIANGLKVPFDELTIRERKDYEVVKLSEIEPLLEDDGRLRNYPIFPDDGKRKFSLYYLTLEKDCLLKSDAHLKGCEEYVTIFDGTLEIKAGERVFIIEEGDSLRFKADEEHSYRNIGEKQVRLSMLIYNP